MAQLFYFECLNGCGVQEASTLTAARLLLNHKFGTSAMVTLIRPAVRDDIEHVMCAGGYVPPRYRHPTLTKAEWR